MMKDYSNYHEAKIEDKITHDGNVILDNSLNGFESYAVKVNGDDTRYVIHSKYSSQGKSLRNIIGRVDEVQIGNMVEIGTEKWLIISWPEDNKVYRKATIQQCNSFFPLPGVDEKVQTGQDDYGDPIFDITPGTPSLIPCIVETSITADTTDRAINLPEGNVKITISYTEHENLKVGYEFKLYGEDYEIAGIDRTQSINGVGLLIIHGKREVK